MGIDEGLGLDAGAAAGLIEERRDSHADAMRAIAATLPELETIGAGRGAHVDTAEIGRANDRRRAVLSRLGQGGGGLAARAIVGGGLGALLGGLVAAPARADTPLDVQILQTASSLESLAVAVYGQALGRGPDQLDAPAYTALAGMANKGAKDTLVAFMAETMRQHGEHRKAFQAQTAALDGAAKLQEAPNAKFLAAVNAADVSTPQKLVGLAALLEKVATDTYLLDLTMLADTRTKEIVAGVMGVEAQHVATLRTVAALLSANVPQLVAVPFPAENLAKLPPAAGIAGFPDALEKVNGPDLIAEPSSGAVR